MFQSVCVAIKLRQEELSKAKDYKISENLDFELYCIEKSTRTKILSKRQLKKICKSQLIQF